MIASLNHTHLHRLLMAGTFLMPLLPSPALGIMVAFFLLRLLQKGEWKKTEAGIIRNRLLLLPVALYLLYIIGLLWTSNFKYAGLDLQSKLPLLLLPVAIGTFELSPIEFNRIKSAFRYGCLMAGTVLLISAVKQYFQTNLSSVFFYTEYSRPLMHPTYQSMFLTMGIILNLDRLNQSADIRRMIPVLSELLFLSFNMILLSARMALIAAVLVIFYAVIRCLIQRPRLKIQLAAYAIFMVLTALIYRGANHFSDRFGQVENAISLKDPTQAKQHNSASGRVEIWKESIVLLEENWLTGTGTGDVKDELLASYARNNFTYGLERKLNSHNQFLQTFLTLGITGFIVLLSLFLIPAATLPRTNRFVFLSFALMAGLNSMTESILEVQKGALCIAFFFALILNTAGNTTTNTQQSRNFAI